MSQTFYITTPIYYVNDVPHIGHAYTTIAADVLARYRRLTGHDVFFLTGLDEHGQKVQQAAAKAGIDPQAHCDRLTPQFQNLWKRLNVSNNGFIRTTQSHHKTVVQRYLQTLYDKDLIYRAEYTGWYCTFDERFWTEKDVKGGLCPECHRPVEQLSESNYFFRMGRFQEQLKNYIQNHREFIRPETRRNEVLGFLQKPLEDLSISRPKSRLSWGIELPFDSNYVTYVWFDALVNYVSGLEYLPSSPGGSKYWPASLHLVGKDILTTHAVYWSTILMALDLPLPHTIFAHGWWTVNGEKMSKSRGNVVDPYKTVERFSVDAFRYFLLREVPFGQDGDYSEEALITRYNADLANDLGNFLSRTLTMLERYAQGFIPKPDDATTSELEHHLQKTALALPRLIDQHLNTCEFHRALESIFNLVQLGNQYLDRTAPWTLAKQPENKGRLDTVLYHTAEILRFLSVTLYAFLPETAEEIKNQLGIKLAFTDALLSEGLVWGELEPGTKISKGKLLFPRIETSRTPEKERPVVHSKMGQGITQIKPPDLESGEHAQPQESRASVPPVENLITIEDFQKIELKVAKVIGAERVPKSGKLLKLQVDLGTEQRQIVAGIGKRYEPETLLGRLIVVVANLKPAKLMGIESQGMVLAAGEKEVKGLVTFCEEVDLGCRVK